MLLSGNDWEGGLTISMSSFDGLVVSLCWTDVRTGSPHGCYHCWRYQFVTPSHFSFNKIESCLSWLSRSCSYKASLFALLSHISQLKTPSLYLDGIVGWIRAQRCRSCARMHNVAAQGSAPWRAHGQSSQLANECWMLNPEGASLRQPPPRFPFHSRFRTWSN